MFQYYYFSRNMKRLIILIKSLEHSIFELCSVRVDHENLACIENYSKEYPS